MKRILTFLTCIFLLLGTTSYLKAEEKPKEFPKKQMPGRPQGPNENLRQAMEIRMQMRKIEEEAIKNDSELQQLQNQIMELHKQLRTKLDQKLANDTEYQKLKSQLDTIAQQQKGQRQQLKKNMKENKKEKNQ